MHKIESPQNPRVKMWTELLTKKGRDKQHKFLIEGVHLVLEALKSQAAIETIIYSLDKGWPAEIPLVQTEEVEQFAVSESVLKKCSDTGTPQGICAIIRRQDIPPAEIMRKKSSLTIVVDGLQDPGNLGTIIRSADAVQASGVLIGIGSVDVYNPKTVRSTMGSLFHVPFTVCDLRQVLPVAKARSIQLVSADLRAEKHCYDSDFTGDTWFIIGNEARGISPETARFVDRRVRIPMHGQAESLNAAMAATILLYEAFRQRHYVK